MSWILLGLLVVACSTAYLVLLLRRAELSRMARAVGERQQAKSAGTFAARLQHPQIDLKKCLGCTACLQVCPEEGVLDLIHGQAAVVHGAHCVGHGHCEEACPSGAITVGLANVSERRDLPVVTRSLESVGSPGMYLAGEITGHSLIRSAIEQGRSVARAAAERSARLGRVAGADDLIIVGAGPAGMACAVEAAQKGLRVRVLEQGELGGTIAQFPRRKLVLTQPVHLPGWGTLDQPSYSREELLQIWRDVADAEEIAIESEVCFQAVQAWQEDRWKVLHDDRSWPCTSICFAIGRRGSPRRLGIPGEELPKVQYSLVDSRSFQNRRIVVVGGGDTAVETALALDLQPGNRVTLVHRGAAIERPVTRNRHALQAALEKGRMRVVLDASLEAIEQDYVRVNISDANGSRQERWVNDDVFITIGGIPSILLLEACGVSFDPATRLDGTDALGADVAQAERKRLIVSLSIALSVLALALLWTFLEFDYYRLDLGQRPFATEYERLRPAGSVGLWLGVLATAMVGANLAYVLRRSEWLGVRFGRMRHWMTAHVVTGILALLFGIVHGGMHIGDTPGGHAALGLGVLVLTGAMGRYLYAFVPRAISGRDLAREEVLEELRQLSGELDESAGAFGQRIREISRLEGDDERWEGGFLRRLWNLWRSGKQRRLALAELQAEARAAGRNESQVRELSLLVLRAQRSARASAHFEELRGMLSTWRHIHGWLALLFVLILAAHILDGLRYGDVLPW